MGWSSSESISVPVRAWLGSTGLIEAVSPASRAIMMVWFAPAAGIPPAPVVATEGVKLTMVPS